MRIGGILLALALVAVAVTGCVVYNSVADTLPDPTKPLRGLDQSTQILDRNGKLITNLFAEQDRTNVALKDIPLHLRQAVIATEDERYYEHPGFDLLGMMRALVVDLRAGAKVQGGSTITQQYVKTAFISSERTARRKIQEVLLAYRMEQRYSKDKILEMYLNTIYFGRGAYGVESAARVYFGKPVGQLTVPEAAMIAGVIKSPRRFSPYLEPAAAKVRRDVVLGQMRDQGYLTEAEYSKAVATGLKTNSPKRGSTVAAYFVEYLKDQLVDRWGEKKVYREGLRVVTTLDLRMQHAAENAVGILNRPSDPSAALVAIDPRTGQILAMVGGRDFTKQQYNVAVQGANRQTGSSFKPFVLATALEEGVSPEQTFESGAVKLPLPNGQTWSVTGHGKGLMRLREATAKSVNSVFAQLVMKVGADKVVNTAKDMGITSKITPVPAVALGGMGEGVTPLDMASAYGTLADSGNHAKPYAILQVTDAQGKVLDKGAPFITRAIDHSVAYLTTDMLRGVISSGTGESADIGRPAAGKTGTTQENRDAWFVGYTPNLVASVWVGFLDNRPMNDVHGIQVTGGTFPARIWAAFMKTAVAPLPKADFVRPPGLADATICLETGELATSFCPKKGKALFLQDHLPKECSLHKTPTKVRVPSVIGMQKVDAIAALERAFLRYSVQERDIAGKLPGTVTEQTPRGGSTATTSTTVVLVVASGSSDKAPTAGFDFVPRVPGAGVPVKFDGSGSSDDGTITKWVWEFGDGSKDFTSGKVATHKYGGFGTYNVTLWVTDNGGHASSVTHSIIIR